MYFYNILKLISIKFAYIEVDRGHISLGKKKNNKKIF